MNVEMNLPYSGLVNGMGIPQGITLIVGGGYHGKSTLLEALEKGVYNHILGDGREFVITDETAMKIRAEDGRSIRQVDISMFIQNLPNKIDTTSFYTEDASGSTSQAANVAEAIEADCNILLIDEDTSATNFMIRDDLMQRVIKREHEPIIPYIERIRELYDKFGISTILVAGSSGAYFEKADVIIQMESYSAYDITEYAKKRSKKIYLKDTNMFVLRQINNKINTMVISMSLICLMLFMTISILSSALSIKNTMQRELVEMTPVDINLVKMANLPEESIHYGRKVTYTEAQREESKLSIKET